jgi:hypothetical protein
MNHAEIEIALAAEAEAHARASAELNPFGEAEAEELGSARLVYSGAVSRVHGVYALGLDGPPEERDWKQILRFFSRLDRDPNYFTMPATDPSVLEEIRSSHRPVDTVKVYAEDLASVKVEQAEGISEPNFDQWALAFSRRENPARSEPDLLALTKIHQKSTRFYLNGEAASYTFFHRGIALISYPVAGVFDLQRKEAAEFKAHTLVVMGEPLLPFQFERICHEPI